MQSLRSNDAGVTAMLEYILTFVSAFIIFTMLLSMFNGMFIQGPQRTVATAQFADVGNDVTAKIMDTYLIAPKTGNISTTFSVPERIAGQEYTVDIHTSANGWDEEILVHSPSLNMAMSVTLNGVSSTIPISGSTSSMTNIHQIKYDSLEDE